MDASAILTVSDCWIRCSASKPCSWKARLSLI